MRDGVGIAGREARTPRQARPPGVGEDLVVIMVWPAARGGMRSVVEGYVADGFTRENDVRLVASYEEGSFVRRQAVFLRALAAYATLLFRHRVRLVHIHAAMKGSFWRKAAFATLARARGVPVLLHLHGSEMKSFYDRQPAWGRRAIAGQLARATRVAVLSESWRDFVARVAPSAKPVVVPNGVAVPKNPARGTGRPVTLLFLGLVGRRKGVHDLLDAFAAARRDGPDMRLLVGGNGEVEEARAQAATLGLGPDAVSFLGWVGPDDKAALLDQADIFLLPSHNEGLPMSVLEAMAYGLPVVTTRVGGIPELVTDGLHGRLLAPGDRPGLAAAIAELASDASLRRRMGEAGRSRVQAGYSREALLPRLAALYDEIGTPPDGRAEGGSWRA